MAKKPTYEELEQQVRELEKEVGKHKEVEERLVDLKRTEEVLRFSEERLRLALEGTTDGIWDWNLKTGQVYFSPRYYTMLGYEPDEFPASYESWRELLHPDDVEAAERVVRRAVEAFYPHDAEATKGAVRRAIEEHSLYAVEFRLKTKDGEWRWILSRSKVVESDVSGKAVRMAGSHTDITERKQTEEALLREKHFSDTLIDSMPGAFCVFDEQGRFTRWNKRVERTTGYFAEEISHMKPTDFFVGEEKDYILRKIQEVFTNGETEAEVGVTTKGGRIIPNYFKGVKVLIGGKPHVLAVGLDISDRKRAESRSARLQLLLKSVILQSPVPMALALPDGTVEMFNESCRTLLGLEDELHLQPGLNLFTMETSWKSYDAKGVYIPLAESPLARALQGKTTRRRELKVVRKNRTERWILVDAVPIYDENGQIMAGFNIFPDITERKQAEESLRESAEYHRIITDTSMEGFVVTNSRGKFQDVNEVYCHILGYSRDELLTMSVSDIEAVESPEEIHERIKKITETGSDRFETRHRRKDGRIIDVEVSITPIQQKGLQLSFIRDITDRKMAEEALRKRETELEIQSQHLQEVNSALKVLLRQRQEDKKELQESVVANVEELVFPYLEKLSEVKLDDRYRAYIKIIQSNLNDIISPFIGVLSSKLMRLTPTEVQVANFIKHGKTTKDIAEMLNLSVETIKFHRKNIRDKIGIKNKKGNLRTYLLSVR